MTQNIPALKAGFWRDTKYSLEEEKPPNISFSLSSWLFTATVLPFSTPPLALVLLPLWVIPGMLGSQSEHHDVTVSRASKVGCIYYLAELCCEGRQWNSHSSVQEDKELWLPWQHGDLFFFLYPTQYMNTLIPACIPLQIAERRHFHMCVGVQLNIFSIPPIFDKSRNVL